MWSRRQPHLAVFAFVRSETRCRHYTSDSVIKPYLNPALLFRGSFKVTFPDTLCNTIPQTPALPFTLFSGRCGSDFFLWSGDVMKYGTS